MTGHQVSATAAGLWMPLGCLVWCLRWGCRLGCYFFMRTGGCISVTGNSHSSALESTVESWTSDSGGAMQVPSWLWITRPARYPNKGPEGGAHMLCGLGEGIWPHCLGGNLCVWETGPLPQAIKSLCKGSESLVCTTGNKLGLFQVSPCWCLYHLCQLKDH